MLACSVDEHTGITRLVVEGLSSLQDYQSVMPDLFQKLEKCDKLLLEVRNLDRPLDHVDPDLAFTAMNELKFHVSSMAVAAPPPLLDQIEPLIEIMQNVGTPVRRFGTAQEAEAWLKMRHKPKTVLLA